MANKFADLNINPDTDPELNKFVEALNTDQKRLSDYHDAALEYFANRIYELRKNQSSNTPG